MRYADKCCTYTETHKDGKQEYHFSGPCVVTGKSVTVTVPAEGLYAYRQGAFIQDAFPTLTTEEREFLISGMSKEAFDKIFGGKDEEDA